MKKTLPLSRVYGLLEPGPVVLLTTARGERQNIDDAFLAYHDGVRTAAGGLRDQ